MQKASQPALTLPEGHSTFYAIAAGIWGKGATESEALANLRKQGSLGDRYLVYSVSAGAEFYNDGSFGTPNGERQPVLLKRVRKIGNRWNTENIVGG